MGSPSRRPRRGPLANRDARSPDSDASRSDDDASRSDDDASRSDDSRRSRRSRRAFLAAVAGAGTALAGCSFGHDGRQRDSPAGNAAGPVPEAATPADDSRYTDAYRQVARAVTTVRVTTQNGGGLGSGAVVAVDGQRYVVTNQHVVAGATHVSVVYNDGEYAAADVGGTDVYSDLAVLRTDFPGDPPALTFATEDPAVGREVIAVGTPFGVGESVSGGVVSGVDRSLPGPGDFSIPDAIQTDAAANPGNSGGPLVALDGTPLGLVNSVAGNDVTFAISGALMGRVLPALVGNGEFDHSYVGVGIAGVTPALARANGLDTVRGVYVDSVREGGPAAGALRGSDGQATALGRTVPTGGDVIRAVNGTEVPDLGAFGSYLALHTDPGETVRFAVVRNGQRANASVTLGERPGP